MSRVPTLALAALAALASGCATLPPPQGRVDTTAIVATDGTRLGRAVAPQVAAHPGKTGVHPMPNPHDAFATRMLLAKAAESSIDAQYYLWHADDIGLLLFEALWEAAGRGVRVRLLLDDANTKGLDPTLATLDAHPNVEVRLYNPMVEREHRLANFVWDFDRVNRRMHNKSFTVDGRATVVGGRNIADEYFGAGQALVFADLDVVAIGPAVAAVAREFDLYWNSASAYPAAQFVGAAPAEGAQRLLDRFAANRAGVESRAYLEALQRTPVVEALLERRLGIEWVDADVRFDDPAKTRGGDAAGNALLFPQLVAAMGHPESSFELVSPYFVPGDLGAAALAAMARRGVRVRVLTNSLASTDIAAVHAGYAKRRRELLEAGVRLFEMKPDAAREGRADALPGSSASSGLHAKTFAVDGRRIFVGSFNFDQRSALLNTEMGLVIASPTLAGRLGAAFDTVVPQVAYEVVLSPAGDLAWIDRGHAGERRFDVEPGTTWLRRTTVEALSLLPIDWLL